MALVKVKTHSNNTYNDQVDKLAKDSLSSDALQFNINDQLHTTLYYKQLAIATPIRHFIKEITRSECFESFLHLDTNKKYVHLNIDWIATTHYISDNIASTVTSYKAAAFKKYKGYWKYSSQ